MVAGQAPLDDVGDERRAGIRVGAVADDVAQAPHLVGILSPEVREHGFERRQVAVDVGDDRYAQGVTNGDRTAGRAVLGAARSAVEHELLEHRVDHPASVSECAVEQEECAIAVDAGGGGVVAETPERTTPTR